MRPQAGTIAQRPVSVLNIVKTMPEVNMAKKLHDNIATLYSA